MSDAVQSGVVLGLVFGAVYVAAGYATHRWALRHTGARFAAVALGGLTVRLVLALAGVTAVLVSGRVAPGPFVGTFLAVFLLSLGVEVVRLTRRRP